VKLNNTPGGKFYRNMGFYLLFLIIVVSLVTSFMQQEIPPQAFTYTEFIDLVKGNEVESVTIMDKNILGHLKDGTNFTTYAPEDPQLIEILRNQNVNIDAKPPTEPSWWSRILGSLLPTALLIIVWIFLLQQFQGGGSKVTSFSKSHARMVDSEKVKVTFDDVAGLRRAGSRMSGRLVAAISITP
jgi:cell division protease FtsH